MPRDPRPGCRAAHVERHERTQRVADERRLRRTPAASSSAAIQSAIASTRRRAAPRPSGRAPAGRRRARCGRDARSSATAAPRRCGRSPRRGRTRRSAARVERPGAGVARSTRSPPPTHGRSHHAFPAACSARRQVLDQVVGILEADRQPDRALGDAGARRGPRRTSGNASSTPGGSPATSRRRRWRGARRASAPR